MASIDRRAAVANFDGCKQGGGRGVRCRRRQRRANTCRARRMVARLALTA